MLTMILGKFVLAELRKLKAGQEIRQDGPTWHNSKAGTPTMGGIAFILGSGIAAFACGWQRMLSGDFAHLYVYLFALIFGLIGFVDDYRKVRQHQNEGLTAKQKFILQLLAAVAFLCLMRYEGLLTNDLYIPFVNVTVTVNWIVYLIFAAFVIVGCVNAVNLTDGIDGLASSVTSVVMFFFLLAAILWQKTALGIFSGALFGSLVGFFALYNHHPAKCALLAGATLLVKRIRGIRRAAMGPVIPTATGHAILCDCGANADCTPEYLLQFAYLGSFYAQRLMGVEKPRVGLLNIGSEPSKGDTLRHETFALLEEAGREGRLNFIGNVEANTALLGGADVIVADGYSGNILLKTVEGTAKLLLGEMKKAFLSSTKGKLGALLVKDSLRDVKKLLDPSEVGGTPFLGISKPVLKAHGSSDARAIRNAVFRAVEYAQSGIIADVEAHIDVMKVEKNG